jgi:hypothetical protein
MIVVPMGYIRFVFICAIVMMFLLSSPVHCATEEEKALIYYSEDTLTAGDIVQLEQGYSFKLVDANEDSGDILVKVYHNGKEIEVGDAFGDEDSPFEYIITIKEVDDDEEDEEIDYVVIRITPVDFDEKDDSISVEMEIEQFLDPEQDDDDFLTLDSSRSVKLEETLSLDEGYTLDASDMEDDSVILELSKDGKSLKKEELEIDDIFSYSKTEGDSTRTIFIARVSKFFESSTGSTVILKDVTQRPDLEEDETKKLSGNISENKSNETLPLMSIPDSSNNKDGINATSVAESTQNSTSSINEGNDTGTDQVNTNSFMPILFLVIIITGFALWKFN